MDVEYKHDFDFQRISDLDRRTHNYMLTVATAISVKLWLASM
jgi:hypothetical protein